MADDEPFMLWVANTVHAISGIWPQHLCGLAGKWSLTFAESRSPACQALSSEQKQALSAHLYVFGETSQTLH